MSFQEVLAELAKSTVEERRLLIRRIAELDAEAFVEESRAHYGAEPATALSLEKIVSEVRLLPREAATELLDRLLLESVAAPNSETEAAWRQEIRRRVAEVESGTENGVDGNEVLAEVRKIVGR